MKNRIVTGVLAAVLAMSMLVGCGNAAKDDNNAAAESKETTSEVPESKDEPEISETTDTLVVGLMGTAIKPVGVLVADALGYYKEEGVDIQFEKVSSMNDAYAAVANGDLDVYLFSSTAAATFISQGSTTLRVFGGTAAEGCEIMAAAGSDITLKSAEDFKGLVIGDFMAETGQMVLKNWLIEQGLTIGGEGDNADVTFIYYNDNTSAIEAVKNGDFDLILTNSSLGYYAEDYGVDVVARVSDFVPVYPCCRQTCNETTYNEKSNALVKFEIASLRGYEYFLNDKEGTLDILEAYSGADRAFLEGQLYGTDAYVPSMRISLDPDKDACVAFYKAMANIGEIESSEDISWSDYVVADIYETALKTMMEREPEKALWTDMYDYFKSHNTI